MATIKWKLAQKLELKWWKNYLGKKDVDEYLQWKRNYWMVFLHGLDTINVQSSDSILDIGCGPAGIFTIFPNHKVTAVDPLIDAYENNLDHFDKERYPKTEFVTSSIEGYQPNNQFDMVFCLNAINHVADIDVAFDRLFEYVKPKGKLVVSIDSHNYKFLKHLFRLIPGDALHPHQYDLVEYEKFITKRGGKVIQKVNSKPGNIFDYWVLVVER